MQRFAGSHFEYQQNFLKAGYYQLQVLFYSSDGGLGSCLRIFCTTKQENRPTDIVPLTFSINKNRSIMLLRYVSVLIEEVESPFGVRPLCSR